MVNGGEKVYQLVHDTFEWALKRTLPRKLEACLYGSNGERQRGEGFLAYTARKLQQYRELETSGLALPSQVKGHIMIKHGKLSTTQWETLNNWTGGSLDLATVSDALRRLDRPAGANSLTKETTTTVTMHQYHHDDGSWNEDEELTEGDEGINAYEGPIQLYHLSTVTEEQLRWDQGDDQIVYVPPVYADQSELSEDQAVSVYANYQQVRAQLHNTTLSRGYYDRGAQHGKGGKPSSKGGSYKGSTKGQKGSGKTQQAYPFRTRLSELIARTKCARCGERGHWARSCTQPRENRPSQGVYWAQAGERAHAFVAFHRLSLVKAQGVLTEVDAKVVETPEAHVLPYMVKDEPTEVCATASNLVNDETTEVCAKPSNLVTDKSTEVCVTPYLVTDKSTEVCVAPSHLVTGEPTEVCVLSSNLAMDESPEVCTSMLNLEDTQGTEANQCRLCFPSLDRFIGLQLSSNLALIDTGAESGVMGTHARDRLTRALADRGLTPQRVKSTCTSASGVGGKVMVEEVLQFPIGAAGHRGVLRAAILPDPEVPILLPASMLLKLGAILNLPKKTIHWTELGETAVQPVHVLPSGHMAVDIMDFDAEAPATDWVFSTRQIADPYDLAVRELQAVWLSDRQAHCEGGPQHCPELQAHWQENGITVLPAELPQALQQSLMTTTSRVLPLADNNRPQVQNGQQTVRSLTLGCYTRRGLGVTCASEDPAWRALLLAAHAAAKRQPKSIAQPYLAVTITEGSVARHTDQNNQGDTNLLVLGDFSGGNLLIEQTVVKARNAWVHFNPQRVHAVEAYDGVRRSFAFYSPKHTAKLPRDSWDTLERLGFPVQQLLSQQPLQLSVGIRRNKPGKKERQWLREHASAIAGMPLAQGPAKVDIDAAQQRGTCQPGPSTPPGLTSKTIEQRSECSQTRDSMVLASMATTHSKLEIATDDSADALSLETGVPSSIAEGNARTSAADVSAENHKQQQRVQP
eukprot:1060073-Amphidinium_carterae.1